jgi:hypothetical protein
MLRRVVGLVVAAGFVVVFAGLLVTWLVKSRAEADRESARNSLRELGQFAAEYHKAVEKKQKLPDIAVVPPGTVGPPTFAPDQRVSWVYPMLPLLNQKRQNTEPILKLIDPSKPWDAAGNAEAGRIPVRILLCPAAPPTVAEGDPAVTQFVGIAGIGADAATLPPDSPRAGAFRYDTPTDLSSFKDGLTTTLLFGETNHHLGPWIRGGPSTVRGLIEEQKLVGVGGQFGGIHVGGANFGLADGGVRWINDNVTPRVLLAMATRAGGAEEAERVAD